MPFSWRIKVANASNTLTGYLLSTESIDAISSYSVEGSGNCLEASIQAFVSGLTASLRPVARGILTIQTSSDGLTWNDKFLGFVIKDGATRNLQKLTEIKLIGLKQRFYEQKVSNKFITGADVGQMVRDVVSLSANVPAGVTVPSSAATSQIPDQSFSLGNYYPRAQSVGEFLDTMAQRVENIVWGVDPSGAFFWRQDTYVSTQALTEGTNSVFVNWQEKDALDVVDKVNLVLADKSFPDQMIQQYYNVTGFAFPTEFVTDPIVHSYDSGNGYDAEKLELLPWSDAWLDEISTSWSGSGFASIANINDGDDTTYSGVTGSGSVNTPEITTDIIYGGYIRYFVSGDGYLTFGVTQRTYVGATYTGVLNNYINFPNSDGQIVTQQFVICPGAWQLSEFQIDRCAAYAYSTPLDASDEFRIYEIVLYTLDTTTLDSVAQSFIKSPPDDSGYITITGQEETALLTPTLEVDLTLKDASVINDIRTKLFNYSITKAGIRTQVQIGQVNTADAQAVNRLETDRIERLDRKVLNFRR